MRVQDLDFERRELTVRDGKGGKDRRALLPESLSGALQEHLEHVRLLHQQHLTAGWGAVELPYALARKHPHGDRQWGWQWVFPQRNRWKDVATGQEGRHHLDPSVVQKAVKQAVQRRWTGLLNLSAAPPQISCLPLRGSVIRSTKQGKWSDVVRQQSIRLPAEPCGAGTTDMLATARLRYKALCATNSLPPQAVTTLGPD